MQVQPLSQEDLLEKETWQPTPVFLPGEFHRQRSLAQAAVYRFAESDPAKHTGMHNTLLYTRHI